MNLREASVKMATQMEYVGTDKTGVRFRATVGPEELTLALDEFHELGDPETLWLYLGTGDRMWR